jgi:hypothetical protein
MRFSKVALAFMALMVASAAAGERGQGPLQPGAGAQGAPWWLAFAFQRHPSALGAPWESERVHGQGDRAATAATASRGPGPRPSEAWPGFEALQNPANALQCA